tara:strand:- start:11537 stop:14359 length:2823 start_codon:yes stop_codon:yes gene_type:complete
MPTIHWQKIDMPARNSLQGNLFEDSQNNLLKAAPKLQTPDTTNEDLSDDELTADAKNRPRSRKSIEMQENANIDSNQDGLFSKPNKNPSTWSHHKLVNSEELTPVLRHYVELKIKNPERILLYRLGDFFECFFEDAIQLSQLLELTLTGKEGGKSIGRVPMAGIPHHAAERYCAELIKKGLSVALCDQLESSPSKGGALIKRGITRVITPGTIIEEGMLQARKNNWLGAVLIESNDSHQTMKWGLASADISTGEFLIREGEESKHLLQELLKLEAAEIICGTLEETNQIEWCPSNLHLTEVTKTPFSQPEAQSSLKNFYKLNTIQGLGLENFPLALRAAGGLISYLQETKPLNNENQLSNNSSELSHIPLELPKLCFSKDVLIIDAQTRRNLEITSTQKDGQFQGSLLWAIDKTLTAMGGRCLRRWLEEPLLDINSIKCRQEIVSFLVNESGLRNGLRKLLRTMGDLERLSGRAGAGQASGRDLVAISDGLERLPRLSLLLKNLPKKIPAWLESIIKIDPDLNDLSEIIQLKLTAHPPLSLTEGGIIHDGVDTLLDGLRNQIDDQNEWLNSQEKLERNISGINNLKLQYHRTFGYFLSVSKSKLNNVPNHWIRRQTLANEERFITPDLKAREGKIFQLKGRAAQREYEIFCDLRLLVGNHAEKIRKAAKAIAGLDSLCGLAELAATNSYTAPKINATKSRVIDIEACRHPVVEQMLVEEKFRPNDIHIGENYDLIILTGPNASGKSCYLRQIGLIQLLTQIGSWVPAKKANVSIADRIFTRVGAVDDLAAGQSTFMVEMSETAFILNQATKKSLVLLDEIGRGTSTFDGLSIAWSVSEYLAEVIKSRTIFATHYHELNTLTKTLNNVANFQVIVEETGDDLSFLHQIVPGGANKSYGIEAARLAGVPKDVVKRAKNILKLLQQKNLIGQKNENSAINSAA